MKEDTLAILKKAREMLSREGAWTQRTLARYADRNAAIADGYRGGKSVKSLMEEFDVSEKTVRRAMAEHGAGPRKGGGK